jgi:hypothetical protein
MQCFLYVLYHDRRVLFVNRWMSLTSLDVLNFFVHVDNQKKSEALLVSGLRVFFAGTLLGGSNTAVNGCVL